jgi:N utilization substance protein B
MDRMAKVDRNVLRLAVYELRWRTDVPVKVCINEAIELGKKYGSESSAAFVNGVLDRVASGLPADRRGDGPAR